MARNINNDHHPKPGGFYPMTSRGNRIMVPTKVSPEKRVKALEELLTECELKTAGPDEALCTLPNGSIVAEGLQPATKKEAVANESTLMESLIGLGAAIKENERLTTGSKQLSSSKESTPKEPASKEPMPGDLLIDLSAEGIAVHDWVKAGANQSSITPKELAPKKHMPMDLLVELSAEERAGTLQSVIREQDWLVTKEVTHKEPTRKEPVRIEPVRIEPTRKEPTFEEPARNELTRKGPISKEYTRKEPTRTEPTRRDPTSKEPNRREPNRKEPIRKEPTRKEPSKEPTPKEPAFKDPTPMGTLIDLSNVPRIKVAPLPPMLHGIRHLLGIQRTYEKAVPVFSAIPALVPAKKYDYPSPNSVPSKQSAAKYSSTPAPPHMRNHSSTTPPHMRILSMAEGAATPPHMRTPSEKSSLTRSLSPASSSSCDWVEGAHRGEEREW